MNLLPLQSVKVTNEEQKIYQRGYSRGYLAGRRGTWPDWAPPAPPDDLVKKLFVASQELATAAATVLQAIIPDEEIFLSLQAKQIGMDEAFEAVTKWLLQKDQ